MGTLVSGLLLALEQILRNKMLQVKELNLHEKRQLIRPRGILPANILIASIL
jgi:hypothetical protein